MTPIDQLTGAQSRVGSIEQMDAVVTKDGRSSVGETIASPLKHRPAPLGLVHPNIQVQLGPDATANTGDTTTLPPVTVHADATSGSFIQDYSAFLEAFSAPPPDINQQEDTLEPGEEPNLISPEAILQANEDFNALPEDLQEMILASPTATQQMARFFTAGGQIEFVSNVGTYEGQYQPGNPPKIILDQGTIQAAMDGDNDTYENGILIVTVAHELGHWVIDDAGTQQFDGNSLSEYVRFRAEGEALAIVNSMIISGEVEYLTNFDVTLTGYATDAVLGPLYSTFQQNHNLDALIDALADIVENNNGFVSKATNYWNTWYGGD